MGLWVKDGGESERRLVMRRIEVAPSIRQHRLTRKRADFHRVSRHEKLDGDAKTGIRRKGSDRSGRWREPALFSERKFIGTGVVFSVVS